MNLGDRWRSTSKDRRALALFAMAMFVVLICALVAQVPPPTDANSLGPPKRNIEDENCYCHINTNSGKEPDGQVEIVIDPTSPDKMVTGGMAEIMVTINFPTVDANTRYGYAVDLDSQGKKGEKGNKMLEGAALEAPGGTPSENKTHLTHSSPLEEKYFNVTLTAPKKPQVLLFTVVGMVVDNDGTERGDHWNHMTKEIEIFKVREVDLNATITNTGDVEAKDINVSFLVDGEVIGIEHIAILPAGGEQNVSHKWDATFYDPGDYKVQVMVDPNQTTLELDEDNNVITKTVTIEPLKKEEKPPYDWRTILYGLLALVIVVAIIWILYRRFA
jgi:hypothetical protein